MGQHDKQASKAGLVFSANIGLLFTEIDFPERFKAARDAGFDAVEFPYQETYSPEEVAGFLASAGLVQSLANVPYTVQDLGVGATPGHEEIFEDRLERALRYCAGTGCKTLHVLAGKCPPGVTRAACMKALSANLARAAVECEKHGVMIVAEAINLRDVPTYSLESVHAAAELVRTLNVPNVRLLLDLYHAGTIGEDMTQVIEQHAAITGYVQLAGFNGRHEPSDGATDYAALLNSLTDAGYAGFVGCEYLPQNGTQAGLSWLDDVKARLKWSDAANATANASR